MVNIIRHSKTLWQFFAIRLMLFLISIINILEFVFIFMVGLFSPWRAFKHYIKITNENWIIAEKTIGKRVAEEHNRKASVYWGNRMEADPPGASESKEIHPEG